MSSLVGRAALAATFLSAPLLACGDGAGPPSPARVLVTNGDRQVAPINTLLPAPIVVTVVDGGGQPMAGVQVQWRAVGADRLIPIDAETDANGQARAQWLLGAEEGERSGEAALPGLSPAVFTAVGEGDQWMPFDELAPLDIATYDGSGQVVHPDYAATPAGAFGRPFHLAITPYPFGNPAFENPSFFEGDHRDRWTMGDGASNPVVLPDVGYLSDPDLVYVPEQGELWLYYRQVTTDNLVLVTRTKDGRQWSAPVEVARAPNHAVVSPSVVRRAPDDWWMFAVNAGPGGCTAPVTTVEVRRSTDGLRWGPPGPVALEQPDLWPWHIDVQWIPSRQVFWAVYNAKTSSGCTTPAIYLAESADGLAWTPVGRPVLVKGATPAFQDIVYRTTFEYDPLTDAITFWFSGARFDGAKFVWSAAVERRHRADVFAPAAALEAAVMLPPPAPLVDWP
jgi:hypothetical protein